MRYFLGLMRLERINFFLFGFAIFYIVVNFIFSIKNDSSSTMKSISADIPFNQTDDSEDIDEESEGETETISTSGFLNNEYVRTVQKGDSIIKILSEVGFSSSDTYSISKQINELYNFLNINVGQEIKFLFSSKDGSKIKVGDLPYNITIHIDNKIIEGVYNESKNNYDLKLLKQTTNSKSKLVKGYAKEGLYNSALLQGASPGIIMEYIKMLSNEVNFKRDIKNDSEFKILFNYNETLEGKKVSDGNILYAYLSINNKKYEVYQYKDNKGNISYYYADGRNLKSAMLSKPIHRARISSGFGIRFHPISKCNKLHKGVDYAAVTGTPILAAGNGVVQVMRYGAGYGKYLAIKHNNQYSTLYAHMSRFKPGIKRGMAVKQGQVIGYVGSTGSATGAHLHYEIRKYGKPINPIKVKPLISSPLEGQKLVAFNNQKKKIDGTLHRENKIMLAKNNRN
jgi:murein DD-endopeptidase MepM/ murein hydrolase activator NlpD